LALEAVARLASSTQENIDEELTNALVDLKELYSVAVQTTMRPFHEDFRAAMSSLRKSVIEKVGWVRGPVTVNILAESEPLLFPELTSLSLFIEAALRSAALCMPEGSIWLPGDCPTLLEAPPLLMWEPGDPLWSYSNAERLEPFKLREQDFRKVRGGPPPAPSVFIAHRMESSESKAFRLALEQELAVHPRLATVKVKDGKMPIGTEDWAKEIRYRISSSNLVVGDCTGMRPEVVFELGFAYGLGIPVLPVVATGTRSELPYWLRRKQVGEFQSERDLGDLVASIEAHLADPSLKSKRGNPPPVPGLAVWIRSSDWTNQAIKQFQTLAQREGLTTEIYSDQDSHVKILERATLASFLVVTVDGTDWDAFAHYVCGAVVARPEAGYGAKRISRKVLVVEPPTAKDKEYTAEGLSRCEDTVMVTKPSSVREETRIFLDRFRQWSREPKS
jgi:nucleoside 2-deoxyribosyltransferase